MQKLEKADARALLQSTQQLRTHWSGVITTHIGYAIALNVAIWSYLLKSYIDSLTVSCQAQPSYMVLAAALSAMLLGMWRLYTHEIDNYIAGLYPDFLLYESVLSVPYDHGTSRYLIKAVPRVRLILLDNDLTPEQRLEAISTLVKSKRIGRRGHLAIDLFALVIVILLGVFAINISSPLDKLRSFDITCFAGIGVGLLFILSGLLFYQRNPSEEFIKDTLSKLKKKAREKNDL